MHRVVLFLGLFAASSAGAAGPEELHQTYRFDLLSDVTSDGTYVYARHHGDRDRYCWGRVLRIHPATGEIDHADAPCYASDFVIRAGIVYFSALNEPPDGGGGGLYRHDFGDAAVRLTEIPAGSLVAGGAYLYYGDGTAVHRVSPDGSGDTIISDSGGQAKLLLDGATLYGVEGRTLWRLPTSGGSPAIVATLGSVTEDHLIDGGELLWIDGGNRIRRVPLSGGTPTTFYATKATTVDGLAVVDGHVYWGSGLDLKRRPRAGGAIERVVTAERYAAVAGSDASGVYYTHWTTPAPPQLALRRVAVAELSPPVCSDEPVELMGATAPMGIAATGSWVYFTEGDTVKRVWHAGGASDVLAVAQPGARNLFADANELSWVTDAGVNSTEYEWPNPGARYAADAEDVIGTSSGVELYFIDGARLVGPDNVTLATGIAPHRLALGATYLYWTDRGDGSVRRVRRSGGAPQILAHVGSGTIGDLTTDSNGIFVGVDDGATGRILRLPFTGGTPAVVASGAFSPYDLDDSGSSIFFTSQGPDAGAVYRVSKAGGTPVLRAAGGEAWELDVLGSCIYYATATGVHVVSTF